MKLGIIGLPQTGKKTLFKLLTGSDLHLTQIESGKPISGIASIRDKRFDKLVEMYKPKKEAPARIEMQLLPKLEKNTLKENEIFRNIADVNALCHVVRAFNDDSIYHVSGSVDPVRDIESINSELVLHDMIFIEKRLERLEKESKKKSEKFVQDEQKLLEKMRDHLEKDLPLRVLSIESEEKKIISGYPFLTLKRLIVALNIDDSAISGNLSAQVKEKFTSIDIDVMQVCVKLESEIEALDSEDEKNEFMSDAGITEPALNVLTLLSMKSLGQISFFTVGQDEVRQWMVRAGSPAPVAAGVIHSDIQRGFIRAEVMKYSDIEVLGSEDNVKKAGKHYTMGKDYIVEDGDIISFRFNV